MDDGDIQYSEPLLGLASTPSHSSDNFQLLDASSLPPSLGLPSSTTSNSSSSSSLVGSLDQSRQCVVDTYYASLMIGCPLYLANSFGLTVASCFNVEVRAHFPGSDTALLSFPPHDNCYVVQASGPGFSLSKIVNLSRFVDELRDEERHRRATTAADHRDSEASDLSPGGDVPGVANVGAGLPSPSLPLLLPIIPPSSCSARLLAIVHQSPIYGTRTTLLASCVIGPLFAPLFSAGKAEVLASLPISILAGVFSIGVSRLPGGAGSSRSLDLVVATVVSLLTVLYNKYVHRIAIVPVLLSSIVWSLPGLPLTLAVSDISRGHATGGMAKLVTSLLVTLNLGAGILVGLGTNEWFKIEGDIALDPTPLPWYLEALSIPFITLGITILLDAKKGHVPQNFAAGLLAYYASSLATKYGCNPSLSAFLASLSAGLAGHTLGLLTRSVLAIEFVLVATLYLVPGSLGVKSILTDDPDSALALLFQV